MGMNEALPRSNKDVHKVRLSRFTCSCFTQRNEILRRIELVDVIAEEALLKENPSIDVTVTHSFTVFFSCEQFKSCIQMYPSR